MDVIVELFSVFTRLSLQSFGGAIGILPEMRREVVDIHGWLTDTAFVESYAVGQLAPGPNMLSCFFIGYQVAGVPGALAAGLGMFLPPAILTIIAASLLGRLGRNRWMEAAHRASAPLALGLMASGTLTLVQAGVRDAQAVVIALIALTLVLWRRTNPAVIVIIAAVVGVLLPSI